MAKLDPWGINPEARAWINHDVLQSRLWSRYNKALKRNYSTHGRGPGNAVSHFWLSGWGRAFAKWRDEFQRGEYTTANHPVKVDDKMTDGPVFVTCPECGAEQGDAGRGVSCEECGHSPMPTDGDDDSEVDDKE